MIMTNLVLGDESFVVQGMHSGNVFSKFFLFYCISCNACIFEHPYFFNNMSLMRRLMDDEIDVSFSPPNSVADFNSVPNKGHQNTVKPFPPPQLLEGLGTRLDIN